MLLIESRERLWMMIFAVREFFEDESQGLQIRDRRRQLKQVRLRRLKLDRREWLIVRSLSLNLKIVDA